MASEVKRTLVSFLKTISLIISISAGILYTLIHITFKRADIRLDKITFFKLMFRNKGYGHLYPAQVKLRMDLKKDDFVIIDVRKRTHYNEGHIKGALSIPFNDLFLSTPIDLDKDREIIVTCYGGGMSRVACSLLLDRGFTKVYNMSDGIFAWTYGTERST